MLEKGPLKMASVVEANQMERSGEATAKTRRRMQIQGESDGATRDILRPQRAGWEQRRNRD